LINNAKPRNVVPKPEKMREGRTYAFTVNPEAQYFDDVDRIERMRRRIKFLLNSTFISYRLYMEISSGGRLHFHGYVKVRGIREFYNTYLPFIEKHATIDIEEITNDEGWEDYIIKQCPLMRQPAITKDFPPTSYPDRKWDWRTNRLLKDVNS